VAISFVRSAADIQEVRGFLRSKNANVPIVAKLERAEIVANLVSILHEVDVVMVARGDLGVEVPLEEVPVIQKEVIRQARQAKVPVIVATQMLESMIASPRPTRAEATDVATAVLDGADAIMLSGETAIGAFPIEAARAAARIAEVAEDRAGEFRPARPACSHRDEAAAVAHAAAQIAGADPAVVAIACYTGTGRTAELLSSERPTVPIYAFAHETAVRRTLSLRWGVVAVPGRVPADTDEMIASMDEGLRSQGFVETGQPVVLAASSPAGKTHTNLLKVHHIGDAVR
jgi:pyruvate kinase